MIELARTETKLASPKRVPGGAGGQKREGAIAPASRKDIECGGKRSATPLSVWWALLGLLCFAFAGCSSPKTEPDYRLLTQAWNTIQRQYVDKSVVQPKELTYGAINGMVDALGDTGHSAFLTPEMARELKNMERGEFKGVGLEIQMKGGRAVVVAPVDDSPAQRAGIRAGDVILKVGGKEISDVPLNRVIEQISGRPGTKVTLTIQDPRTEHTRELTITRAAIKLHEVTWHRLPGTAIAHLRLATFDFGVTKDLRKALRAIEHDDLKGAVLDLRNNPGGLLDEAISVASEFLGEGNVLLARDGKGQVEEVPVEKGGLATNFPLVVLVNEGSASAAEIVAGALQDAHRAPLLGQTTFGTGTVLEQFRLSDGSALLLAVEEWLTPTGRSFWHKGLIPEFEVILPPEIDPILPSNEKEMTAEQLQATDDRQLLRALALLQTRLKASAQHQSKLREIQNSNIQFPEKLQTSNSKPQRSLEAQISTSPGGGAKLAIPADEFAWRQHRRPRA